MWLLTVGAQEEYSVSIPSVHLLEEGIQVIWSVEDVTQWSNCGR